MAHAWTSVVEYNLVTYRRTWRGTVFSSFLLPVLFFVGMGISLGAYVDRGGTLDVPYLDFVAPGLLASTALQVGIGESTWPVLGSFLWHRTYFAMQATALRVPEILFGHLVYAVIRITLAALGFLIVMAAFGTIHSWWAPLALPVAILTGAAAAAPVFAFSASLKSENMFALLFRFGVVPMSLFAGVFFPVDQLPLAARWLAYLSPLWHGVELSRSATLGTAPGWSVAGHVLYLVLWAVVGYLLARAAFVKRLTG